MLSGINSCANALPIGNSRKTKMISSVARPQARWKKCFTFASRVENMFTTTSKDENEWQNTASLRNVCRLCRRAVLLDDRSCRQSMPKLLSRCKRCGGIVLAAIQLMLPDQLKN